MRAALVTASVGWLAVSVVRPAGAQTRDLELIWQAESGCPGAAAMRARIDEAAGGPGAAIGTARATAQRSSGQWVVELDAGDGPRALRGDTCDQVARAAALVIGIALRSRRAEAVGRQATDPEVPWRAVPSEAIVEARVARARPTRWQPAVMVRGGAMSGALPELAPMVRAGAGARAGRMAARLEATYATARYGQRLEDDTEALMRVHLVAAAGSGCYATTWLWICAGIEAGAMEAAASAADARVTGAGLWVAGYAGPSLVVALSRAIDLVVEGEAAVPLAYPRFLLNGVPQRGPDGVSIRTGLGLRVAIP